MELAKSLFFNFRITQIVRICHFRKICALLWDRLLWFIHKIVYNKIENFNRNLEYGLYFLRCFKLNSTCYKFYKLMRVNFSYYLESLKTLSEKVDYVSKFLSRIYLCSTCRRVLQSKHMLFFSRIIGRKRNRRNPSLFSPKTSANTSIDG